MIPYNSTTFGIANYIEKYFVNENVFMAKNFKNNFYLAAVIQEAVEFVTPESPEVLKHLQPMPSLLIMKINPWHGLVRQVFISNKIITKMMSKE